MNSINNSIIEGVLNFIKYSLNGITANDQRGYKLELLDYKVVDPTELSLGDLMAEGLTRESEVILTIQITDPEGNSTTEDHSIFIPTLSNGMFVIEGKKRVVSNTLTNSPECRCEAGRIKLDYGRWIAISLPRGHRNPEFSPLYCSICCYDLNGDLINVPATEENFEIYRNFLKLTDEQRWKLQVKLDTDSVGDYLTYDLAKTLYALGEDRESDSIIDKMITSIDVDFYNYLNRGDSKWTIYRNIYKIWFRNGYLTFNNLNTAIKKYFRVAQSKCIEIPSNINPLIYDSLRYKVTLPANVMYNQSFVDLIDASNTPENNNVNILNELNVATSLQNGKIFYTCYSYPDAKLMKLNYLEYLTKPVLKCDFYDYDNNVVKPDKDGNVTYTLRLKMHKIKAEEVGNVCVLIEPKPDDRLSYTTRRIPLVNMSDSVRVSMGAAMIRQAIQTQGCEPRLVQSGNDEEDIQTSANLIPYTGLNNGVVEKISKGTIFIRDKVTGGILPINIPAPIQGANQSIMTYSPSVKEGDEVLPGQVVALPRTMRNNTYNLGINANAVYMNYLGLTYEDGVVVSESYARRATHYSLITVTARIKPSDQIRKIAKIGKRVKSVDLLIRFDGKVQARESITEMMQGDRSDAPTVFKAIEYETNARDVVVPNNTDEGYIVDIKVVPNPNTEYKISDYSQKVLNDWMRDNTEIEYGDLPDEYRNVKSTDEFEFTNEAVFIQFVIIRVDRMKSGDKSSNSWGGKGEIALVLPDECMPRLDEDGKGNGRPFDIIMNPAAVIARKNISQLYECLLTKCIHEIFNTVNDCVQRGEIQIAKDFTKEYYGDKFLKMTDEEFIEASHDIFNFAMKVGSYAKIDYDTVLKWADGLDIKERGDIYVPDVVIYEGPDGRSGCTPEYAKEHGIKGKYYELGFADEPVVYGESYMYKLYHTASYSGKCTPKKSRKGDPLLGRGLYRQDGQKLGEMEGWALSSKGATSLLTYDNPNIQFNENLFITQMMLAGLAITDSYGIPYLSGVRKSLKNNNN